MNKLLEYLSYLGGQRMERNAEETEYCAGLAVRSALGEVWLMCDPVYAGRGAWFGRYSVFG